MTTDPYAERMVDDARWAAVGIFPMDYVPDDHPASIWPELEQAAIELGILEPTEDEDK